MNHSNSDLLLLLAFLVAVLMAFWKEILLFLVFLFLLATAFGVVDLVSQAHSAG